MKKILALLFIRLTAKAFGLEGVVIVHEAPLLEKPEINSKVLQIAHLNDVVTVHPKHDRDNGNKAEYKEYDFINISEVETDGYYHVMTKSAEDAYIPKRYLKIVYNDERESRFDAHAFANDPTDYRLEEPLPKDYPLFIQERRRAIAFFSTGPGRKMNYKYRTPILNEKFSSHKGFQLHYLFKVNFDKFDRFYFGPYFRFMNQQNKFTLTDQTSTQETRALLSGGSKLNYDIFRGEDYRFNIGGGVNLNWDRLIVQQRTFAGLFEERIFQNLYFSPVLTADFHYLDLFPNVDFVVGFEIEVTPSSILKTDSKISVEDLWNQDQNLDQVVVPFGAQYTLNIGVLSKFP